MKNLLYIAILVAASLMGSSCGISAGADAVATGAIPIAAAPSANSSDPIDRKIADALAQLGATPDSAKIHLLLASLYIRKARSTGDFSLNAIAEQAVSKALALAPDDASALKLQASLHLTYHRFDQALAAGEALQKGHPDDAFVYGVLADANAELGYYAAAVKSAHQMIDLKPNTASYARVAHLRSLYGDKKGAIEMFTLAARTADPDDKEAQSWCLTQLADEHWKYGEYTDAERVYDEALRVLPGYYLAQIGKGRVRASLNDLQPASEILLVATTRIPNVEATIILGNVYQKMGDLERAKQQYDLAELIETKLGVSNDQKRMALLWADQGTRLEDALEITTRESSLKKDILTRDAYAWSLYKKGLYPEAHTAILEALQLKTNDARTLYHAGMIENALGNKAEAKRELALALKLNPAFDLIQADVARKSLLEIN